RRRLIRRCRRTAGGNVHAPRRTGLDVIAIRSLGQGQRLPSLSPLRRRQCRDTAQPAVKLRHVHGSLLASQESAIADTNNQRHESLSLTSCIIAIFGLSGQHPCMLLTKPCPDAQYDKEPSHDADSRATLGAGVHRIYLPAPFDAPPRAEM